jgi:hypothetical protein
MRLKVDAMTGAPIASAITSTVIGEFVIAWMTKNSNLIILFNVTLLHSNN